jgi:hypothetical protein
MLNTNGFGSVKQKIVFTLPATAAGAVKNEVGFELVPHAAGSYQGRPVGIWHRWTTRRGDDESIVMELGIYLNPITKDWEIDWLQSDWI